MSWKIDQFRVKPSGFLASWRYAAVYTDENGMVSVQPVPGEPFANDCVTSYNRRDRAFSPGQVITTYCNLDTHTRYTIKATDCQPFAVAETTLNDTTCGYQEPLPTPANPPNPYGSLIYVPYKYTEFCNDLGETVRLDIKRKYNYVEPQTVLQVDTFQKPLPITGSTTINVFVDRIKHTVFFTGVAQNDLNSNRDWSPGEQITSFCDYGTGTNLKIYAQSAAPFAYIVEEVNALSCQIPTEEPEYIENWGDEPIVLSYKGSDNKLDAFTPCECVAQFLCTEDFSLEEFYTNDEREFKGVVSVDGQTVFEGFIIPDSCQEPFAPTPYEVSIRMTDGLGSLKNITYPIPYASKTDLKQTFLEIIAFCLASTNLTLNIRTIVNVFETNMLNGPDNDPLGQASVNPLRFTGENGRLLDCYQVLESVLTLFKANIRQAGGEWVIVRPDELASQVARTRVYNNKAFFLYSETINPLRNVSNLSDDNDYPFAMDQHTLIGNAYKRASVFTEFAKSPAIVFNGDFEQYDGQNFNFWTKYGGIDVSRVQNTIPGNGLARIPIEDYAMQFNARADAGKWIQSNDILVVQGDGVQLSFSHSPFFAIGGLKFRVKLGEYYLTNAINGTDFQWVKSLSTVTILLTTNYLTHQFTRPNILIKMPEAPASGLMVLQFFGPQQYDVTYPASIPVYVENNNYTPVDIDNVAVAKTSKVDSKAEDGMLHVAEQGKFYSTRGERTTVLFGEYDPTLTFFYSFEVNAPITMGGAIPIGGTGTTTSVVTDNLHAIYVNNAYSTAWYEYGSSSGRVPIGLLLAKSIMKSYQKPFRYISGSFRSEGATMLNTYRFDFACNAALTAFSSKIFGLLSCDINLKSNSITSVNLAEMFDKYIPTIDISQPHHPGDVEPPIFSNPNTPPQAAQGVFTNEFTSQFT